MTAALEQQLRWLRASTQEAIADRDRVIDRLLDGWHPETLSVQQWFLPGAGIRNPYRTEPMSDGEAAIIRAHQERTTVTVGPGTMTVHAHIFRHNRCTTCGADIDSEKPK